MFCVQQQCAQLIRIDRGDSLRDRSRINGIAVQQPSHKFPTVILPFCRVRDIRSNKCIIIIFHYRPITIYICGFVRIIYPFDNIFFASIRIIGHRRAFNKHKMQIRCRNNIIQIIGINDIPRSIDRPEPFALLFLVCQTSGIFDRVSGNLQKDRFQFSFGILFCVV